MSARTTTTTTRSRRIIKTTCIVGLATVLLAHYARADYVPDYDHATRDYYLIRTQSPHARAGTGTGAGLSGSGMVGNEKAWTLHEDQQQSMGNLLGLRFESAVGQLPDYFLYSAPKRFTIGLQEFRSSSSRGRQGGLLTKRSTVPPEFVLDGRSLLTSSIHDGPELENESGTAAVELDPIVERFHALKRAYAERQEQVSGGAGAQRRRKRNDLQAEIVQAMGMIERQELRQRNKKRAPLPDSDPNVQQQQQQSTPVVHAVHRRGGGENRPKPLSEEDLENAAEEEEVAEEEAEEDAEEASSDGEGGNPEEDEGAGEETEVSEDAQEEEEAGEGEGQLGAEDDPKTEYQPQGEDQPDDGFAKKLNIGDPGFRYQWHLHNTKDRHDINVTGVWEQGINGTGVNVAIIDDGLDMTSEDLAPNFFKEGSWDFNDHTALPLPRLIDDQHGTRCAGEIAAAKNDLCGLGVAYGAKVAGLRILSGVITDVDEAAALNYRFQDNHIYSCSWGPPDDGQSMDAPKGVVLDAMKNGIKNGRSGLGSIFVFATGNGGSQDDDCNFDGYTNSLYTVSIGAIDRAGRHPYYSEACSAQLAVTYSNGGGSAIYTCDVGERRCFDQHGGTSAAAPIAAGMIALVLSVRPDLNWRDVQYLVMTTAIPVSLEDEDWTRTAAGRLFNHKFGYGSLDAYALVESAKTFQSLGPQTSFHPAAISVNRKIPQNSKGVVSVLEVTAEDLLAEGVRLGTLEHITVTVNIEHARRGDVEVVLISPNKIESRLGVRRRYDSATTGFPDWTFMTVKHWDENPVGEWTLTVRDQSNPEFGGKFVDWRIQFWGETKGEVANIQAKPSMPSTSPEDEGGTKEKLLNEEMPPVTVTQSDDGLGRGEEGQNTNSGEVTVDVGGQENKEEGEPSSELPHKPADKATSESKVILEKDPSLPKKLGKDKENLPVSDGNHNVIDSAQAEASGLEADSEDEVASMASRTLYAFCAVIGVAGLIAGYITRHKWDGRGQYASVRVGGIGGQGRRFENDDDIDLLPRGLRSGRSDLSLTDYEGDESSDRRDGSGAGKQRQQRRGLEMESRPQQPDPSPSLPDEGEFELGSDTDNEDFLPQSMKKNMTKKKGGALSSSRLMKQTNSSPATLLVDDA